MNEHAVMIMVKLWIGHPFSLFQADILNVIGVCPSQLTWNAWAFILCFEVICLRLNLEPLAKAFLFFFTHAQQRNGGWTHFLQRSDRVIIKNMLTSIRSWKDTFFKVCLSQGYRPFFLNERCEPYYPLKWSVSIRCDGWDYGSLSNEDQNVVAQSLVVALLDAQVLISMIMNFFFFI